MNVNLFGDERDGGRNRPGWLMLSSGRDADVEACLYPESGKVGVFGASLWKVLRDDAELDCLEGEE
jgi:hypothetical protein